MINELHFDQMLDEKVRKNPHFGHLHFCTGVMPKITWTCKPFSTLQLNTTLTKFFTVFKKAVLTARSNKHQNFLTQYTIVGPLRRNTFNHATSWLVQKRNFLQCPK